MELGADSPEIHLISTGQTLSTGQISFRLVSGNKSTPEIYLT